MKDREQVTTNGRAVFYASMWEDLKNAALNCGWSLALHGSLNSDMDIMAMPWTEDAKHVDEMINSLCSCFTDRKELICTVQVSDDKPNNRVVYTIPIFADFYLDINVIRISKKENKLIPNDANSFEVFSIKDSDESPTGKQAFIGYKIKNGNFHFIGVPFTDTKFIK